MQTIYLSGYTRNTNRGIHQVSFDPEQGKLVTDKLLVTEANPTYIALSKDNKHLYTLTEWDDQPGVNHYEITDDQAKLIDHVDVFPGNGCYISLDEEKQVLYLADYHHGALAVVSLDDQGKMTLANTVNHQGSGPHPNQEKAHAHFLNRPENSNFIYSCDLGTDQVHTYQLDADQHLQELSVYTAEPGTGPRHLAFHPSKKIAYLIGELSYTVDVLTMEENGELTFIERYHSIPDDWNDFNSSSAIRISQDGQFLYVSNRGHNSITAYKISENGEELTYIDTYASQGDFPRDFNFTADENYLVVGHQKDPKITVFKRDKDSGELTLSQKDYPIDEIVCVVSAHD